jgi:septal ring factor EnvC (AmiA/AmiB activator)
MRLKTIPRPPPFFPDDTAGWELAMTAWVFASLCAIINYQLSIVNLFRPQAIFNFQFSIYLVAYLTACNVGLYCFFLPSDAFLRVRESLPKVNESLPKVNESLPKVNESLPKVNESLPKVNESLSKVNESLPKVNQSLPKVNESLPKGGENLNKVVG